MRWIGVILLLFCAACKESYDPPIVSSNKTYLVVEGFINNGPDSTYITITHTFKLDAIAKVIPELHAHLTIEGKDNSSYTLTEWGSGQYGLPSLSLNNAVQYRLHIRTAAGKDYLSDYLDLKPAPAIDSVSWRRTGGGVQIYANTHDPKSASHYYRWDYQETWEFHSFYFAYLQWLNNGLQPLSPNPYYTCWKYRNSTNVLTTSTTKLTQDRVAEYPLVLIPTDQTWIISVRYSIQVKQYVLSADAYNFWVNMQRNTEQVGSIFSPQPSGNTTNLHSSSDSTEQIIGFVSAGTLTKQRIFITPDQVPNWAPGSYTSCEELDTSPDSAVYFFKDAGALPIDSYFNDFGQMRYHYSTPLCVDCRLTGVNIKPPFW